jgi:hypothetical protein
MLMSKARMSDPAATRVLGRRTADIERVEHFKNVLLRADAFYSEANSGR